MSHLRAWLALTVSTAIAALALTGCTGSSDPIEPPDNGPTANSGTAGEPGGKLSAADSPLQKYRDLVFGDGAPANASEQERWRLYAEQQNRMSELVSACMAKEGFDYPVRRVNEEAMPPNLSGSDWEPENRDWAARYGYGLLDYPGRVPPNAEPEDDPDEGPPPMSEAEEAAWQEALFGPELAEGEEYDWRNGGCHGAAEHEVMGDQAWREAENQPILEAIMAFPQEVASHPDFVPLDTEWAACMAERNHPEFTAQQEAPASIQALLDDYFPADEDSDEPDPRTKDPRFATLDDPAYAEIAEQEVALAVVDLECREQTDYAQRRLQIQFALEQQFVDDHKAELDAALARLEAGR
ncbi:MAG: hypothetical protein LCH76_00515 [Actinobacteria bacterium]|nr:hypothetical protein [Actinomycetota bacterium]